MKFIYLDTETTGLNFKEDSIFQLSGIIKTAEGEESFNFNMRPYKGKGLDATTSQLTGKTDAEVFAYPDQAAVFRAFIKLLEKYVSKFDRSDKFFIIGYNVNFDIEFLREWFIFNGEKYFGSYFWNPGIDVMALAANLLVADRPYMKDFKLATVYEYVCGKTFNTHDAFEDIKATRELHDALFKRLLK